MILFPHQTLGATFVLDVLGSSLNCECTPIDTDFNSKTFVIKFMKPKQVCSCLPEGECDVKHKQVYNWYHSKKNHRAPVPLVTKTGSAYPQALILFLVTMIHSGEKET